MLNRFTLISLLLSLLLLSGCAVHRLDIQQGNIIKTEQVELLKLGINKRQVRFIMGTPLLQDPFNENRWDYVFTLQPGDKRRITEYQRVTVFFEGDLLSKIEQEGVNP